MKIAEKAIEHLTSLLMAGRSLSVAFSGGKDSHATLILTLEAIRRLTAEGHQVPRCFVVNSDTRRENPIISEFILGIWGDLELYITKHNLPIEIVEVEPALTGRWTWTCLGRGKLPRYESSKSRDCAVDEKVAPQVRAMKRLMKESGGTVVSLVGSRFDESSKRAESMARYKMDEITIVEQNGSYTYAPIASWHLEDVWELIVGVSGENPKLWRSFRDSFDELASVYRDANDGVCGVISGDNDAAKKACGSRFGCAYCVVQGERDQSMESMIAQDESRYGFMKGLVKYRKFLRAIRWDLDRRDWRGRKVSEAGWIKTTPDYFDASTKLELLRYLLTLDALEVERAEQHEERYFNGEIPQTPEMEQLCYPMFQFVKASDVAAIDWCWSVGRDFQTGSMAARAFIEVHDLKKRFYIPDIEPFPRVEIPEVRWFDVSPAVQGLTGLAADTSKPNDLSPFAVSDVERMEILPEDGWEYLEDVRRVFHQLDMIDIADTARMLLERGYVKARKADIERYQSLALRNDYLLRLWQSQPQRGPLIPMNQFLRLHSISDREHSELLREFERQQIVNDEQLDILGADSKLELLSFEQPRIKKSRGAPKVGTTNVRVFRDAASQMALAI